MDRSDAPVQNPAAMLFNSQVFILGFLPAVLVVYYALAGSRPWRQGFLVAASLIFYGWWDVRFVPLLVGLTLANWGIVRWFAARQALWITTLGVGLNLSLLGLFKYADFFRANVFGVLGEPFQPWRLILPLGISFFVFQKISYLVDLRRGDRHIYGLLDFSLFVTFFPQLIAGPLVRHNEIIHQFRADPRGLGVWENLGRGWMLFAIGVAKKVLLADTLQGVADPLFAGAAAATLSSAQAWLAAIAFSLQIYFDFSGYSDMAIGLARMFGLRLPQNFDAPYRSVSIRDFWRRWHMTLSRFLRDYLYIPLGGNRVGPWRQAGNVVATMLLGGLWHGASWNFVAWGGLHGLALAVQHVWNAHGLKLPKAVGWTLTLLFVTAGWVLFRSPDFTTSDGILRSMAGFGPAGGVALDPVQWIALAAGTAIAGIGPTGHRFALEQLRPRRWIALPAGIGLAYVVLLIGGRLPNVFIYFQF